MEIKFSRHAKRRMQRYKVEEDDVIMTLKSYVADKQLISGKQEVINKKMSGKYGYPLKVIFSKENDKIVVITAYPLRKKRKS